MTVHYEKSIVKYNVCLEMKTKQFVFLFSFSKENHSLRESFNYIIEAQLNRNSI